MRKFLSSLELDAPSAGPSSAAEASRKRPLPGGQARLRDCAKVVVLDRRDDPAQAAAALLPSLTAAAENAVPADQLAALRKLACLRIDSTVMMTTGVGTAVRRLKRSPDVEVAVVRIWIWVEGRTAGERGGGGRGTGASEGDTLLTHNAPLPPPFTSHVRQSAARLVDKWKAQVLDEVAAVKRSAAGGGERKIF
jgi:hypothetical protein